MTEMAFRDGAAYPSIDRTFILYGIIVCSFGSVVLGCAEKLTGSFASWITRYIGPSAARHIS